MVPCGKGVCPTNLINGAELRQVLIRQGLGKAQRTGGWGPSELAVFPTWCLGAPSRVMGEWKTCGAWPAPLRNILFSMIPEPKAETEAAIRQIGFLSYICQVWIAICKLPSRDESLRIHDRGHVAAAVLAARTRARPLRFCTMRARPINWPSSIVANATRRSTTHGV